MTMFCLTEIKEIKSYSLQYSMKYIKLNKCLNIKYRFFKNKKPQKNQKKYQILPSTSPYV